MKQDIAQFAFMRSMFVTRKIRETMLADGLDIDNEQAGRLQQKLLRALEKYYLKVEKEHFPRLAKLNMLKSPIKDQKYNDNLQQEIERLQQVIHERESEVAYEVLHEWETEEFHETTDDDEETVPSEEVRPQDNGHHPQAN